MLLSKKPSFPGPAFCVLWLFFASCLGLAFCSCSAMFHSLRFFLLNLFLAQLLAPNKGK